MEQQHSTLVHFETSLWVSVVSDRTVMLFWCFSASSGVVEGTNIFPVKIRSNFIMGSKINNDVRAVKKHVDKTSDITAYKHFSDTDLMVFVCFFF